MNRTTLRLAFTAAALIVAAVDCEPLLAQQASRGDVGRSFYMDRRANREGDVLTVVITENSTVSTSAQTQTNKSETISASVSHNVATPHSVSADIDSKSAGGGLIERTGKLVANLAVTVRSVDERGNLRVHGEQDIQVNNERQRISLDGYVRAEDIGPDNTIPSYRVAGARIEFTGKGLLARKQSPGLINRILSWFWE